MPTDDTHYRVHILGSSLADAVLLSFIANYCVYEPIMASDMTNVETPPENSYFVRSALSTA